MLSSLRKYDAYAKTLDDFRIRTRSGGIVTLVSSLIILLLVVSEWNSYRRTSLRSSLLVDTGRKEKMDIYLNITFPKIPCFLLSLDVMDVSGEHQNELAHDIYKERLDPLGVAVPVTKEKSMCTVGDTIKKKISDDKGVEKPYCGSCYGGVAPPSGCCNTCVEVQDAYRARGWTFQNADTMEQCVREGYAKKMEEQSKEGCNIHGLLTVNKVAVMARQFDFSHTIHYLSFGKVMQGIVNPMDNMRVQTTTDRSHLIQNFIKVVGTRFLFLSGTIVDTNQFSVTEYSRDVSANGVGHIALPGVFFNYDISPMLVVYREETKSFASFITSLCAIVGGVFTVASLVDAAFYKTARALQKKGEIGKLS